MASSAAKAGESDGANRCERRGRSSSTAARRRRTSSVPAVRSSAGCGSSASTTGSSACPTRSGKRPEIEELTKQRRVPVLVYGDEIVPRFEADPAVPRPPPPDEADSCRVAAFGSALLSEAWKPLIQQSRSPTEAAGKIRDLVAGNEERRRAGASGRRQGWRLLGLPVRAGPRPAQGRRPRLRAQRRFRRRRQGLDAVRLRLAGRLRRRPARAPGSRSTTRTSSPPAAVARPSR